MSTNASANAKSSTTNADEASVAAASTNVISNEEQSPYKRKPTPRPRTFNSAGVQTIKGGSPIGAGFFDSITSAYTNLVNSPLSLIMIFVGTFIWFSINNGSLTPIGIAHNALLKTANDSDNAYALRSIAALFTYLLNLIIQYQNIAASLLMFGGIYIAKPSTNHAWLCSFTCLIDLLGQYSALESVVLAHCILVYTQIRNPSYKMVFGFLALVCVIMGFTHVSSMVGLSSLKAISPPGGSNNSNPDDQPRSEF